MRDDRAVAGERADPLERVEVGGELAVGVGDDGGAAAEHGVAGEQGVVGGQGERDRVGRVARGGDHPQLEPAGGQHVAVAQVVVAAPHRAHPGAGELGEPGRRLGVVVVPVGEHRLGHPGAALLDDVQHGGEVPLVERAGVDDDGLRRARLEQHPGVGAVERHRPGVGRQHAVGPGRDVAPRPGRRHRRRRGGTHPPEYAVAGRGSSCGPATPPSTTMASTPTIAATPGSPTAPTDGQSTSARVRRGLTSTIQPGGHDAFVRPSARSWPVDDGRAAPHIAPR